MNSRKNMILPALVLFAAPLLVVGCGKKTEATTPANNKASAPPSLPQAGTSEVSAPPVKVEVPEAKPSVPPIAVGAEELEQAYNSNEIAADLKYKDKKISLSGGASDIKKVGDGNMYEVEVLGIHCFFDKKMAPYIAILKKYDEVQVVGFCAGKEAGSGMLKVNECSLEKRMAPKTKSAESWAADRSKEFDSSLLDLNNELKNGVIGALKQSMYATKIQELKKTDADYEKSLPAPKDTAESLTRQAQQDQRLQDATNKIVREIQAQEVPASEVEPFVLDSKAIIDEFLKNECSKLTDSDLRKKFIDEAQKRHPKSAPGLLSDIANHNLYPPSHGYIAAYEGFLKANAAFEKAKQELEQAKQEDAAVWNSIQK